MPSFTTIYRAVVMLGAGAIIFKGWQLYGPSAEQVKSAVVSAVDMAEAAWKGREGAAAETRALSAVPPPMAPPFANTTQLAPPQPEAVSAPLLASANSGRLPADIGASAAIPAGPEPVAPAAEKVPPASNPSDARLQALLSRLAQLGGAEPNLAAWGSSGNLFRFCCRAAIGNSPSLTQHFESVAEEPAAAVEQVVAKVEAWRNSRRNNSMLP
jgi:hypothetical protein